MLIVALDNMPEKEALIFLERLGNHIEFVKIGPELFYSGGCPFIEKVAEKYQKKIFLDLKLHDIPNTVCRAILALKGLPLKFLTLHLSGGRAMLQQALATSREALPHTQLLGVSYLTSLDQEDFQELQGLPAGQIPGAFERLFKLALETEIPGVVCSPLELEIVKKCQQKSSRPLLKVCPGIRFADEITANDDQKRVLSPEEALQKGADFIVMGRSLTRAHDLQARLQQLPS